MSLCKEDRDGVYFYNRDEPYYQFTNFYDSGVPIKIDGKLWKTTEHYFQAQKFIGTPYVDRIRRLERPREALEMSRNSRVARWKRKDWEKVKCDVMYKALLAKFTSDHDLRVMLASTGERPLVEHSPSDVFWGDGYAFGGGGKNMLGILLMEVRKHIKSTRKSPSSSVDPPSHSAQKGDTNYSTNDISEESDAIEEQKGLNSAIICTDQLPDIGLDCDCIDDNSYYLKLSQTDTCYDENTC